MRRVLVISLLGLAACGTSPPTPRDAERAIAKYVERSEAYTAYRGARVLNLGPCAVSANGDICPVDLRLSDGTASRAFVTLRQDFLEWTTVSFEPIQD
jgi:hypothetical protein